MEATKLIWYSADILVIGCTNGELYVLSTKSNTRYKIGNMPSEITSLCIISPNLLIAGDEEGFLGIFKNLSREILIKRLHESDITAIVPFPGEIVKFLTASDDGTVKVSTLNIQNKPESEIKFRSKNPINDCVISSDGSLIGIASARNIFICNSDFIKQASFGFNTWVYSLTISDSFIGCGLGSGHVAIITMQRVSHLIKAHGALVTSVRFLSDNSLISGGVDGRLVITTFNKLFKMRAIAFSNSTIYDIAISPSGKIATADESGLIKIYSAKGKLIATFS